VEIDTLSYFNALIIYHGIKKKKVSF